MVTPSIQYGSLFPRVTGNYYRLIADPMNMTLLNAGIREGCDTHTVGLNLLLGA